MAQVRTRLSPTGCRPRSRAAPRRRCRETQSADALGDASSSSAVLELVAAHAAGPLGAARVRARRPTDDLDWIRARARARGRGGRASSAGATASWPSDSRRRRRPRPAPDRGQRARRRGAGAGSSACSRPRGWCTPISRRVAELGAARRLRWLRPLPDKTLERRLEQSVDPDGDLLDTASPAPRRRAARGAGRAAAPAPQARDAASRAGRAARRRRTPRSRCAAAATSSRSGATRGAGPPASSTTSPAARARSSSSRRRRSSWATRCARRRSTRSGRRSACCASSPTCSGPQLPVLRDAVEMCVAVDDLVARARYAVDVDGEVPEVARGAGRAR